MSSIEKRCFKCDQLKPITEFYKNRSRADGYADNCRGCQERYRKIIEEKKPGAIKEYNRAYYQANRDRLLAQHRDYMRRKAVEAKKARLAAVAEELGLPDPYATAEVAA